MTQYKAIILGFMFSFLIGLVIFIVFPAIWLGKHAFEEDIFKLYITLQFLLSAIYTVQIFYLFKKKLYYGHDILWKIFYQSTIIVYGLIWLGLGIASGEIVMFPVILFFSIPYFICSIISFTITTIFLDRVNVLPEINNEQ